jgi:hypothetical protein
MRSVTLNTPRVVALAALCCALVLAALVTRDSPTTVTATAAYGAAQETGPAAYELVRLYAAAWDVVAVVAPDAGRTVAASTAMKAALHARPLALYAFGVCDDAPMAGVLCADGWYSHAAGSCSSTLPGDASPRTRRQLPRSHTRTWLSCDVPQLRVSAAWGDAIPSQPDAHNSDERPADVSVVVVSPDNSTANLTALLTVQLQRTLHSLVIFGDGVCASTAAR